MNHQPTVLYMVSTNIIISKFTTIHIVS